MKIYTDADASLDDIGKHARDHLHEVARITGFWVAGTLLLEDRHGDLSQIVER